MCVCVHARALIQGRHGEGLAWAMASGYKRMGWSGERCEWQSHQNLVTGFNSDVCLSPWGVFTEARGGMERFRASPVHHDLEVLVGPLQGAKGRQWGEESTDGW